jgi:hypothetical protein
MRIVFQMGTLALAALSAGCLGSSSGPAELTAANLVRAMQGDGFTGVAPLRIRPFLQCEALSSPGSNIVGGYAKLGASGHLDVQPLTVGGGDRSLASLIVVSNPAAAAKCAEQMLAFDREREFKTKLTDDMIELPNPGGPGSPPLKQDGVVTDGSYEIIGSQGRVIFLGSAVNRNEADEVERNLREAAGAFT